MTALLVPVLIVRMTVVMRFRVLMRRPATRSLFSAPRRRTLSARSVYGVPIARMRGTAF